MADNETPAPADTWHHDWCGEDIPNSDRGHICPKNQAPGMSPLYYCKCPDEQPHHEYTCIAAYGGITPEEWKELIARWPNGLNFVARTLS